MYICVSIFQFYLYNSENKAAEALIPMMFSTPLCSTGNQVPAKRASKQRDKTKTKVCLSLVTSLLFQSVKCFIT